MPELRGPASSSQGQGPVLEGSGAVPFGELVSSVVKKQEDAALLEHDGPLASTAVTGVAPGNKRPADQPSDKKPKAKRQKKEPTAEQLAAKQAKAEKKAADKAADKEAKRAAKEQQKQAKEQEKADAQRGRALRKEIGDDIKSRLKIVCSKKGGYKHWYVPDGAASYMNITLADFKYLFADAIARDKIDPPVFTENTRAVVGDLNYGDCCTAFGSTKLSGGSMYAQYTVKGMTVTYRPANQKLTLAYEMDGF
ncbi:unnamed protein product [Amoebophrya sp. A120]|nr:unnamed protein product [Amoebophrya sp. A120]|eukprot:GSA120T00021454001.1